MTVGQIGCHSGASIQYGASKVAAVPNAAPSPAARSAAGPRASSRHPSRWATSSATPPPGSRSARTSSSAAAADSSGVVRRSTTHCARSGITNGDTPPPTTVTMRSPPRARTADARSWTPASRRPSWVTALTPSSGCELCAAFPANSTLTTANPRSDRAVRVRSARR